METTRKKRGRPTKPEGQARTLTLPPVRVNPDEMSFVETQAATAGMSVSEYVRATSTRATVTPRRHAIDDKLLLELNRAGVNLNQIAKSVNRGQGLPHDIGEALAELHAVLSKVGSAYDA